MVGVVINYCSNEYCFLDAMLIQCQRFTDDIVVSYGSMYYDGQPESPSHFEFLSSKYPNVQFVSYDVDLAMPNSDMKGVQSRRNAYWHNLARMTGYQALKTKEWVLFLDADEIPEGDRVVEFLSYTTLDTAVCYKLSNYWYFKLPIYQATSYEDSIVLIHSSHITENSVFGDGERDQLANSTSCRRGVAGMNGSPMFHHYSWVRSKDGLRKKIYSWGHSTDFPTPEKTLALIFDNASINDIVHNYTYRTVPNFFSIDPNEHIV